MGDYAILIAAGFSKRQAIMAQFTTAIGALLGTVVSLMTGGASSGSNWILPFTAGGFIYVAMVDVLPDLLNHTSSLKTQVGEVIGLCVGVFMMYLIAINE